MSQSQQGSSLYCKFYNTLILIVDIISLQIKFWFYVIETVFNRFFKQEISIKGITVLITGTGHGIGKELAIQYSKLGAIVIGWDINETTNKQTAKEIVEAGGNAYAYRCDVTNREEIKELAAKIIKEHGFVSVIINNAGIMPCHPILSHTETEIRKEFEINVLSNLWIIQEFLPDMVARNQGSIVALSSCAGLFGLPNLVPYCGTKFAVRGLMYALAEELHHTNTENNIKLTTIYPYMVDTGLCKRPRYRFPKLMKLIDPKDAASAIIHAQRTGQQNISIPGHFWYLEKIINLLPTRALRVINDFIDTGVDSDL